jgi:hypothetical protein
MNTRIKTGICVDADGFIEIRLLWISAKHAIEKNNYKSLKLIRFQQESIKKPVVIMDFYQILKGFSLFSVKHGTLNDSTAGIQLPENHPAFPSFLGG